MRSNPHLPVPYEVLVEQMRLAADVLVKLRAEPASLLRDDAIATLEVAQRRMLAAFARCGSTDPYS